LTHPRRHALASLCFSTMYIVALQRSLRPPETVCCSVSVYIHAAGTAQGAAHIQASSVAAPHHISLTGTMPRRSKQQTAARPGAAAAAVLLALACAATADALSWPPSAFATAFDPLRDLSVADIGDWRDDAGWPVSLANPSDCSILLLVLRRQPSTDNGAQ
jgi:hypothetical protein